MQGPIVVQLDSGEPLMFTVAFTIGCTGLVGRNRLAAGESGLTVEDEYVSPAHARVFPRDDHWVIEDLGSTNGTWINGFQIFQPLTIAKGDKIRVGQTTMTMVPA